MPSQQQQQQQLQQPGAAAALNWSTNSLPTFGGGAFAPNVEQQQQQTSSSANLFHDIDPIGGNKKPASFLSDRPAMFVVSAKKQSSFRHQSFANLLFLLNRQEQKQRQQLTSSTSGLYGVSPSNVSTLHNLFFFLGCCTLCMFTSFVSCFLCMGLGFLICGIIHK